MPFGGRGRGLPHASLRLDDRSCGQRERLAIGDSTRSPARMRSRSAGLCALNVRDRPCGPVSVTVPRATSNALIVAVMVIARARPVWSGDGIPTVIITPTRKS